MTSIKSRVGFLGGQRHGRILRSFTIAAVLAGTLAPVSQARPVRTAKSKIVPQTVEIRIVPPTPLPVPVQQSNKYFHADSLDPKLADPGPAPALKPSAQGSSDLNGRDNQLLPSSRICLRNSSGRAKIEEALHYCDNLLGSPDSGAGILPSRARLLQARAVLLLQMGYRARAVEALDEADRLAAAENGPFWRFAGGQGSLLLRAAMDIEDGKNDAAQHRIDEAYTIRPFAPSSWPVVDYVQLALVQDAVALQRRYESRVVVDPDAYRILSLFYLITSGPEPAERAAAQVSLVEPSLRKGWYEIVDQAGFNDAGRSVALFGLRAYALAALGQSDSSERMLAKARWYIKNFAEPKQPAYQSTGSLGERYVQSVMLARRIDAWQHAIELRQNLDNLSAAQLEAELRKSGGESIGALPAYLDMYRELKRAGKAKSQFLDFLSNEFMEALATHDLKTGYGALGERMPQDEGIFSIERFDSNASNWLWGTQTGYTQEKEKDAAADIRTIRYEAVKGSPALAEEQLALAIARYAAKDGYDGFVFLNRNLATRREGYVGEMYDVGIVASARVLMVRGGVIPAGMAIDPRRIMTVTQVQQELGSRFRSYAEHKMAWESAKKAARQGK